MDPKDLEISLYRIGLHTETRNKDAVKYCVKEGRWEISNIVGELGD